MKIRNNIVLPGYLTVAGAAERLQLAPRSVRDLIYLGRLPSARLSHRHLLRMSDVEAERRRRLGLPLPQPRVVSRTGQRPHKEVQPRPTLPTTGNGTVAPVQSGVRRERAAERASQLDRWLRSGHEPNLPRLPFTAVDSGPEPCPCGACQRILRPGGRAVDVEPIDGHPAARLCPTCARRNLLAWSDARRREAAAARRLAQELGATLKGSSVTGLTNVAA